NQVFFADSPRQMGADNLKNERMKVAQQFPSGDFVTLLDPAQAILFVKVVMLHWRSGP
ncbi:MAG: hypothetical protein QOF93_1546, partial [Verrucomicrobiota bacterium]